MYHLYGQYTKTGRWFFLKSYETKNQALKAKQSLSRVKYPGSKYKIVSES